MTETVADYVIVGAGSAGCLLADRLSADGKSSVVLLEAGGEGKHPMFHVPIAFILAMGSEDRAWQYRTEPDIGGRVIGLPRGKVLGGSSAMNGLVYVRGQREDYDQWRQMGLEGWGYDDLLPIFKRSEAFSGGESEFRGGQGELKVQLPEHLNPLSDLFIDACVEAGIPRNADYNGGEQEGVSYFQVTTRNGLRSSAKTAFLNPATKRTNLKVETHAHAVSLIFEGRRVSGVRFERGGLNQVRARKEVVLCAGAIASPHLLMLSGIGDAGHLKLHGIEPVLDKGAIGQNLIDHFNVSVAAHVAKRGWTLNERMKGFSLLGEVGKFLFARKGALTSSAAHVTVFCRTREGLHTPNLQLLMLPAGAGGGKTGPLDSKPGLTVGACPCRPESRGSIELGSGDPQAAPVIRPNYLQAEEDQQTIVEGIRLIRKIFSQEALSDLAPSEYMPGPTVLAEKDLIEYAKAAGNTAHHPVGTCRMGADEAAVVDAQLRVRGIGGLRIADASVMPMIVSGNTNAAVYAIAEKAADLILADRREHAA